MNKKIIFALLICLVAISALVLINIFSAPQSSNEPPTKKILREPISTPAPAEEHADDGTHRGVNSEFYDSPAIQIGWMNRAKAVLDNNLPEGVSHAEVEGLYFHRGFKGWAVACGEVQLYNNEQIVEDFQRFIFPGVQTIYFENQIQNFQIYWDKVCVQESDEYLPESLR